MSEWRYTSVEHSSTGVMVCNVCHKRITEGDYRFRESKSGNSFVNEHRSCSIDASGWRDLDADRRLEEAEEDACPACAAKDAEIERLRNVIEDMVTRWTDDLWHILRGEG